MTWKSKAGFAVTTALLISIRWAVPARSQETLFVAAPSSPLAVGPGSGRILLADFNRDRHLDLLTQHLLQRRVNAWLGDGTGRFAPAPRSPMIFEYQPSTIELADVNNDGILDLGITSRNEEKENVHILLGTGAGAFTPAPDSPFNTSASMKLYKPSLHLVDIDKDGKLDMVTANGRRNTIEILGGNGSGGFLLRSTVTLEPGRDYYSFKVGDVNADGYVDLVTASSAGPDRGPGQLVIRWGRAVSSFSDSSSPLVVANDPRIGALADVNGDRRIDVILTHSDSKLLSILFNDGRGVFTPAPGSPFNVVNSPFAVVAADVNRDQRVDLVAATVHAVSAPFESRIAVLLGGSRRFAPAPGSPYRAGRGAYNLAVGDVNEDGKLDVVASSFEGDAVTLLLGR